MSQLIARRLEELGMNTHQLSKICGMANSYIIQLIDGRIYSPGRDKLIRLGLALHWDIKEINELLNEYKHEDLAEYDVSYLIEAIKNTRFHSGFIVTKNVTLYHTLILTALESIPGPIKLITEHPPWFLINIQYINTIGFRITPQCKEDEIYLGFYDFLHSYRKKLFDIHIQNYSYEHLICEKCFKTYIRKYTDKDEQFTDVNLIFTHFREFFDYILHTKYTFKIINKCPRFTFEIKEPANNKYKPVILIGGKQLLHYEYSKDSIGCFITTSDDIYRHAIYEYKQLEKYAIPQSNDKKELVKYIIGMLHDAGIEMEYDVESHTRDKKGEISTCA